MSKSKTTNAQTVWYGTDEGRLFMARRAYEQFIIDQATDPMKAMVQLISRIQSALGQAWAQGRDHSDGI